VAAFAELWLAVNPLAAVLAAITTLFVHTLWLKRSSSQNIVIGGAAGAVPVLVGWVAVTDTLGLAPILLFALIFALRPLDAAAGRSRCSRASPFRENFIVAAVLQTPGTQRRIVRPQRGGRPRPACAYPARAGAGARVAITRAAIGLSAGTAPAQMR